MTKSNRFTQLMEAAAEAFEDSRSPFETEWLIEHNVSADECFDLTKGISAAITFFLLMASPKGKS